MPRQVSFGHWGNWHQDRGSHTRFSLYNAFINASHNTASAMWVVLNLNPKDDGLCSFLYAVGAKLHFLLGKPTL